MFFSPHHWRLKLLLMLDHFGYDCERNDELVHQVSGRSYTPEPQVVRAVYSDGSVDAVTVTEKLLDVPEGTYDQLRGLTLEQLQARIAIRDAERKAQMDE